MALNYTIEVESNRFFIDQKVQAMLTNIITNPIETPRGYKNPGTGIALRGPLSQFFSGLYLKPLDDAFVNMDVTYLRYQDDIVILCKTKRQMNRCRRRMMQVLHERQLRLSRKKSRIGPIQKSFHFLGIDYFPTQPVNNTNRTQAKNTCAAHACDVQLLSIMGGVKPIPSHSPLEPIRIVPHPRTLRKAREQVKQMVHDGFSIQSIRRYLHRFVLWWVNTAETWTYDEILILYQETCWNKRLAMFAEELRMQYAVKKSHTTIAMSGCRCP